MDKQQAARKMDTAYDEVPYESFSYPQTHPEHMSIVASLFGMTPPDIRTARVLEIGCAEGGNIFPLALDFPEATFVGLDYAEEQISRAEKHKEALGLKNIEFRQQDIMAMDLKAEGGKYDYIIAHGILSWVPEPVRHRLFELYAACLKPNGLGIISYNTLPGWNAVRSLREMMLYHTSRFEKAEDKVAQARALLDFLAESSAEGSSYRALIEEERNILKGVNNSYLYHDHMEKENAQFYLHQFAKMATDAGLTYVGDSVLSGMFVGNMPAKAAETLKALSDVVNQEQYMDFVTNRRFRMSILSRDATGLNRNMQASKIMNYYLVAHVRAETLEMDVDKAITFFMGNNKFTIEDKILSSLLLEMISCYPKPVSAQELVVRVAGKLGMTDMNPVRQSLVANGLHLVLRGGISLYTGSPAVAIKAGDKPEAYKLARYQAGLRGTSKVTNALHNMVQTDDISRQLITLLDGTRTIEDVEKEIFKHVDNGKVGFVKDGKRITDVEEIRKEVSLNIKTIMPKLEMNALLVK